jgi:hypothetical protein
VLEVEVVWRDDAVAACDVVALAWEADGPAGVRAALEEDGEAALALPVLSDGFAPLLTTDVRWRWHDLPRPLLGAGRNEVVVVGGEGPKGGGGHLGRHPRLREDADDGRGVLQDRDDAVEEEAIEAGVVETEGVRMVFEEGVPGGPPDWEWASPSMIPEPAFIWGFQGAQPLA